MNGRAARLIRKFCTWAKVTDHGEIRRRKRAWATLSHRAKGKTRARIDTAMTADPRPVTRNHGIL